MRKKQLCILFMIIISLSIAGVNMNGVSAVGLDMISVVPDTIINSNLTVGENFTVSIYTNYTGSDVWGYEFNLSYNPDVIHGGLNGTDNWIGDNVTQRFELSANVAETPVVPDSEEVYVDGALKTRQIQKNDTWVGDGSTAVYVTTGSPVVEFPPSEEVYVDLTLKTKNTLNNDTWVGDGSTTEFFTTETPLQPGSDTPGSVKVNGTVQQRGVDYFINYTTGNITFVVPPASLVEVEARYKYGHYDIHYLSGTITFNSNSVPGASLDIDVRYTYVHYTIDYGAVPPDTYENASITFSKAPDTNATIVVIYFYGGLTNGDLIDPGVSLVTWTAGGFNNTAGKLSLTGAFFFYIFPPPPTTSGPGILANVTFTVVGYGSSDITLGSATKLKGFGSDIIDGGANPNQLEHGYFRNTITGDANGDGTVNILDILKVKFHWYPGPPVGAGGYDRDVDINDDTSINILDILLVKANWT